VITTKRRDRLERASAVLWVALPCLIVSQLAVGERVMNADMRPAQAAGAALWTFWFTVYLGLTGLIVVGWLAVFVVWALMRAATKVVREVPSTDGNLGAEQGPQPASSAQRQAACGLPPRSVSKKTRAVSRGPGTHGTRKTSAPRDGYEEASPSIAEPFAAHDRGGHASRDVDRLEGGDGQFGGGGASGDW
jgi:uncharacterized membrane protein YgcG